MGKFINTTMNNTVNSIIDGIKHRLDSPFYKFSDKHPTVCTFYNVNDTMSTLDEGNKQIADTNGQDAPLKYNKIKNVFLYGLDRIQLDLDVSDFGLESNEISGECILPPNTFKPYPDSYFIINHLKGKYWFRITKVTIDTLENGSNFWKMEYILDDISNSDIDKRVIKTYTFFADNIGSNYKVILEDESYNFIDLLETSIESLIDYYNDIFFKDTLQTYVYKYQDSWFYDPETIEFIIRNGILAGKKYMYISQACAVPDTFSIQYDRSFYRCIEKRSNPFVFRRYYGLMNEDPMSLLSTRLEEYYNVTPNPHLKLLAEPIETFPENFISALLDNKKKEGKYEYYNIIINYMNTDNHITPAMLSSINNIEFDNNTSIFHLIPILIFVLNKEIEELILQKDETKRFM